MATLAFDSLRYARRLRDAGVPEPQADAQAELMAEAFGFYADNILTKDHFEAVLDARLSAFRAEIEQRFAEQDAKFEQRFAEQDARVTGGFAAQDAKFEGRFGKLERTLFLHTWMLGIIVIVLVLPQLQAWFA